MNFYSMHHSPILLLLFTVSIAIVTINGQLVKDASDNDDSTRDLVVDATHHHPHHHRSHHGHGSHHSAHGHYGKHGGQYNFLALSSSSFTSFALALSSHLLPCLREMDTASHNHNFPAQLKQCGDLVHFFFTWKYFASQSVSLTLFALFSLQMHLLFPSKYINCFLSSLPSTGLLLLSQLIASHLTQFALFTLVKCVSRHMVLFLSPCQSCFSFLSWWNNIKQWCT